MKKTSWFIGGAVIAAISFLLIKSFEEPINAASGTTRYIDVQQSASIPQLQDWHLFTPPSGEFKVLLPSLPQHATEKFDDPQTKKHRQYNMYVAEKENGSLFMISVITIGETQIDKSMLSSVVNDLMARNPNALVKSLEISQFQDNPAIDFSIQNDDVLIDGKAFVVDNTLYVLTYASKSILYNKSEYQYFINSFSLVSGGQAAQETGKVQKQINQVPKETQQQQNPR